MKPVIQKPFGSIHQSWKLAKLPESVFFQEGPGLRKWQWTDDGIKVINVKNILPEGSVDLSNSDRNISLEEFERRYSHFAVEEGDVVVASSGNTYGKVGRIYKHHLPLMMNTSVIRFHPLSSTDLNPNYLFAFLRSDLFRNQVESFVIGSAQPNFDPSHLKMMEIPVPPIATQRKIASILSTYDDLIENNTRRIKILEDIAAAIYRQWFVEFRFPGHENIPMAESELGLIPQGWEEGTLGDIAESVRRNIKPSAIDLPTPYFGLEHLPRKSIALSKWDSPDSINSTKLGFKRGEILFGKIRPYFHKVGVAPLDGICSSDTIVIRPKRSEYFAITLSYVASEHFIEYATITSQGTKMPRADWKVLANYPLIIPSDQIVQHFSGFVQDVIDKIHNLIFRNANLRQTRDLLLPKLISGERDVSKLDIDTNGLLP